MSDDERDIKILAPAGTASRVSRRAFMGGSAVAVFSGSVLLAACGSDSERARRRHQPDRQRWRLTGAWRTS